MAKPELGIKRICLSCSAKFYDLGKDDIECPACGAAFDPEAAVKLKRGRTTPANDDKPVKEAKKEKASEDDSDDLDVDLDDDDEDVLEDTSDLDDDDEVPGVGGSDDDDDS